MFKPILLRKLVIFAITILLSASCGNSRKKIIQVNPAFARYISGYTSGIVSKRSTIRIQLTEAYTLPGSTAANPKFPEVASEAPAGLFSFEPSLKGKAIWLDNHTIEFTPDEMLGQYQFYDGELNLDKLLNVPKEFETFHFQFATAQQMITVVPDGMRPYNNYDVEWQYLSGTIKTTDYADTAEIRKVLTVTHNGKKLKAKIWKDYYSDVSYYFSVDSILRKEAPGKVRVEWDGKAIGSQQTGFQEFDVAGLGDFNVMESKVVDDPDQYVQLQFSDPILARQNLKGIISIKGIENLTYSVDGNNITVYLPARVVGQYKLSVTTGIKNFKGYKMNQAYETTLEFLEPKPLVRLIGNGTILPNSNGLIFPFEAVGLKAVDVRVLKIFENNVHQFLQVNTMDGANELTRVSKKIAEKKIKLDGDKKMNLKQWNRFVIDLGKIISPEPGAIYRIDIKFNKKYAVCDCSNNENNEEDGEGSEASSEREDPSWSESTWEEYGFDDGYDHWDYSNDEYDACSNYYYRGKAVGRNILASDIGIIAKMDEERNVHVFTSNMISAQPLASATIEFYDYQKQLITSTVCNAEGMAEVKLKRKPFLLVAKSGKQRGYMKMLDGNVNSLSKFDVSGEVVQKGVKGFIYGDRGVWRPGDSLYLAFILEDKQHVLPAHHPVSFELVDPNGQTVQKMTKTRSVAGVFDFRTVTDVDAPTGNYLARVSIGNRVFTERVKIETVKPNRLKIQLDFNKTKLTFNDKDSSAILRVKWLHGANAKFLAAQVDVSVSQVETHFEKFRDYEFDSPLRSFSSDNVTVFAGKVNELGEAMISTNLKTGDAAPGMLRAHYLTKVWEEGGDFSVDRFSLPYSPYSHYVGLRTPQTSEYDNTLEAGLTHIFDIATVNADGKAVSRNKINLKIYNIEWRWWFDNYDDNVSSYLSKASTALVTDTTLKSSDGKASFKFRTNKQEYGRYLIVVTDMESMHATGKMIWVDLPYWARGNRSGNENASMLNFSCDKERYACGEAVKITFPSPSDGKALVCVETGTKVLKKFWVNTKKGETRFEFPSTPDMAPNAYLHVALLQPHNSTKNDLPIRMYGVVPVMVDDPQTHLEPVITMPDVLKPESVTAIKVKEKNGKAMAYTLAMVDEGLLDLTHFETPQPWTTFYAREALGIKTWDMYDLVMGAYAGRIDKLLSIGGDGDLASKKGVKANRFKPVVRFAGPFYLEAGKEATHHFDMPNYVGAVRVMVVAAKDGAYGNAERSAKVHKPLMVLATLPRVLGPTESVFLPVDVFAMEKHVKDVKVEVECNELLSFDGPKQQSITFKETGDEVINFKLNVAEKVGIAKVKVTATSGKEKAVYEIELDVRTPNPSVSDAQEMVLQPGQTWSSVVAFKGVEGTNKGTVELSSLPPIALESRLNYLIQYPHGCIEQTTSSVFPQLFVSNLMEISEKQKAEITKNIKAGINRLQLFQTGNGGFSYWPGQAEDSEWGSNYGGHFILEAEKKGYSLPGNLKGKWLKYQQQQAKNWVLNSNVYTHPHGDESNQHIQAYRLYTLALAGAPEIGAMNRLREEKKLALSARWRLAAAYQVAGQPEVAQGLIKGASTTITAYKELSYSYGSDIRDKAMILETLSLLKDKTKAAVMAIDVAKTLNKNQWMSTQETAYCLLAMCRFASDNAFSKNIEFSYAVNNASPVSGKSSKSMYQLKLTDKEIRKSGNISLVNKGTGAIYAKLIVEGSPVIGDKTSSESNLKIAVRYTNTAGKEISVDKMVQGTDFIAEVTITNPGTRGHLKEMALSQVFPSGWEIHNNRMDEMISAQAWQPDYQDIRDDRIYSYYGLQANTSVKIKVLLNATYLGKFYLPTLSSEAMYDHTVNARVPGKWVEVVKESNVVVTK
ncbi:MAG: alpha-2-macroglobulin family protein [Bacteroidia bacterium]